MNQYMTLSVRMDRGLHDEVRAFAIAYDIPISKMLREGIAIYMKLAKGKSPLERRKIVRDEFLALALDAIIADQLPAIRDELHKEAKRRADAFNVAA